MYKRQIEDTISILRGLKEKYEVHHGIRISDSAIVSAAQLSNRYITDRFLPDKAIDLMDEAASRLRMQVDSKPEALDEIDRRLVQLRIEVEALKKEKDEASKTRLSKRQSEIDALQAQSDEMTSIWQSEKAKLASATDVKENLDRARLSSKTPCGAAIMRRRAVSSTKIFQRLKRKWPSWKIRAMTKPTMRL